MFNGQDAVKAKLADGVANLDEVIELLADRINRGTAAGPQAAAQLERFTSTRLESITELYARRAAEARKYLEEETG